jgi:hypothetical protein
MPIAPTPFEQAGELAVAVKWTGEVTLLLEDVATVALLGRVT